MKKIKVLVGIAVLLMLAGVAGVFLLLNKPQEMQQDFERLELDTYNGLFVSSYDIDMFEEDVFFTYRGVPTVIADFTMRKLEDYADYFNEAWESGNHITNIYMGVDPYAIWQEVNENPKKWEEEIQFNLVRYVEAHSDVSFEIMLPYYSLDTWASMDSKEREERLSSYYRFIDCMDDYANVIQYYVGGQEWLIANPGNYENGGINAGMAKELTLLCFCDHEYVVVSGNADILIGNLEELIQKEVETPAVYADLSEYAFVFFGDSVLATAEGSHSIAGVVNGLVGADCYDLAVGGISAAVDPNSAFSLPYMVRTFIAGGDVALDAQSDYANGLNEYLASDTDKKLVFVLNFGFNDYFGGHPVSTEDSMDLSTFTGALRDGIATLKETYPESCIIVQTPTYTKLFSSGQDVLCEDGTGRVLKDYMDAAISIAEEMGVYCLDNYYGFDMNEDNYEVYLSDGCHPNAYGRFVLGKRLAQFAGEIFTNENQ